jgi:hypothetical protein
MFIRLCLVGCIPTFMTIKMMPIVWKCFLLMGIRQSGAPISSRVYFGRKGKISRDIMDSSFTAARGPTSVRRFVVRRLLLVSAMSIITVSGTTASTSTSLFYGKTVQTLHKIKKLPPWTALKLESNPAPHLTIAVLTPHQNESLHYSHASLKGKWSIELSH